MKGEILALIILTTAAFTCGCLGENYHGGGSVYTYSGIYISETYDDIYIEEIELISRLESFNTTQEGGYSHYTSSSRMGYFSFYFFNQTRNSTDEMAMMSFRINDCELAPGTYDFDPSHGRNVFVTNVTFTFTSRTEHDTMGMDSEDREEADRLSEEIYQMDLAANSDYIERFHYILREMFEKEPISTDDGREYDILCYD